MATLDQRVSRLEGSLEHLATKADLANLKADLLKEMSNHLRWMIGLQLLGLAAIAAILRFLG